MPMGTSLRNTCGAWVSEDTPLYVRLTERDAPPMVER